MPIILANQKAEIRFEASQGKEFKETLSQKYPTQKGLKEWLKY
jgi:hypothetical protein